MERYARHLVVECWTATELRAASMRPVASYDLLSDAIAYADGRNENVMPPTLRDEVSYEVRDLEHLLLGNMLTAQECAPLVARHRYEAATRYGGGAA